MSFSVISKLSECIYYFQYMNITGNSKIFIIWRKAKHCKNAWYLKFEKKAKHC